jgi:hypothetical protein
MKDQTSRVLSNAGHFLPCGINPIPSFIFLSENFSVFRHSDNRQKDLETEK